MKVFKKYFAYKKLFVFTTTFAFSILHHFVYKGVAKEL